MEDNQKKGGQQKTSAKRGRTLAGIIVLIILGLVGNRFMGDEGKETGQDNYLADVTITGAPTQALLPEEDGEPSGSGEMDKPDKVPSGADDKDEPDKAPSGTEDKEESDKAPSGTDEEESDKAPSGTDKEESDKAPSGTDKEESDKAPSGTDEEESDKAPSGTEDKEESDKAPSGTDEEESDKAPSGTDGEDGKGEPEADDKDGGEIEILYEFRRESYLEQHFDKHGNEFDYATKEEYLEGANRVIQSPDALHKIEAEDGDDIYYLEETNEFVVVSTDGYIRTYFRPSAGINYYNRQ
ncbi:MAG: hypothetical protein HFG79_04875 [Lachnospiraceae bacterium]|jgi:hypothetical protein|nr:hypothetical protein [Lachnospiraceae bacterium]